MSDPLVTVVLTVRNGEQFLPAALASIHAQGYAPLEIIVVDGQSVDGTARIAMAAEHVRYMQQPDEGLANPRNLGLRQARGDLIAFLDADDEWLPGKLRRQVELLRQDPGMQASVTWLRFLVEPHYAERLGHAGRFYQKDMIGYTPGTLVARRTVFQAIGGFTPRLSIACDADWFARLLDSGQPPVVVPEVFLLKRIHGANMSLERERVRSETMAVIRGSLLRKHGVQAGLADGTQVLGERADSGLPPRSREERT